ncbi:bcl-2-related ovarian killer protein-like [Montipora capricornis]|uniref:bcl-2-related ovarian killer protein-like n=1 Tax=Montipora foliosa TaxID=591990 RepID=UPI0035F11320
MLKSVTKKLKPFIEAKLNEEYVSIANDGNLYCLDYIEERLKRSNIESGLAFIRPEAVSQEISSVSAKIIEVGELLESSYPHLYNNVSKHLKVKLRSEVIVGDIFRHFGRELFRDGVTWGRIVSLFAFSAALSSDCIVQGRPELVKTVLNCVRLYVLDHLAVWIRGQGGWIDLTQKFKCIEKRYSLAFFVRWFEKSGTWLVNSTADAFYSVLYKVTEFISLINSG